MDTICNRQTSRIFLSLYCRVTLLRQIKLRNQQGIDREGGLASAFRFVITRFPRDHQDSGVYNTIRLASIFGTAFKVRVFNPWA